MVSGVDIPLSRVVAATGGQVTRTGAGRFSAAVIDGRGAPAGALFFAIRGARLDGHDFVAQAVAGGAAGAVVGRGRTPPGDFTVVEVDDPTAALGALGQAHRAAFPSLKVVAVTGSNGKTTTKEMIASILAAHAGAPAVLKTDGNLNNHLGVPLTLLRLTEAHRFAVVEMGMSALGEIAYLARLARPDVAVVVNVAAVHLEHLGSLANVAQAKGEIYGGLSDGGFAVAPVDQPLLAPWIAPVPAAKRLTFGPRALGPTVGVDAVTGDARGLQLALTIDGETLAARLPLVGAHNALNAAAAAAVARALGVPASAVLDGLSSVRPAKHRLQLLPVGDRTVLDDCYTASPLSMRAALDALAAITPPGARRVAVLGDMLELGPDTARLHAEVGQYAADRVDQLIAVGPTATHLCEAARARLLGAAYHAFSVEDAASRAAAVSGAGDVLLIKASRGMQLERVIAALEARLGAR
jgi:UDP-N-acetylmuramoyl-tripeptide--D-alanyl-D-alanine ligase